MFSRCGEGPWYAIHNTLANNLMELKMSNSREARLPKDFAEMALYIHAPLFRKCREDDYCEAWVMQEKKGGKNAK